MRCLSGVDENLRRVIDEALYPFEKIGDLKDWISEVKDSWIIAERDLEEPARSCYSPSQKRVVIVADEFTSQKPVLKLVHEFLHVKHAREFKTFHGKDLTQILDSFTYKPPFNSAVDFPKRKFAVISITEAALESFAQKTELISEEVKRIEIEWGEELTENAFRKLSHLSNYTLILNFGTCLLVAKRAGSNLLLELMESRINLFPRIEEGAHRWAETALMVDHFNTTNWENLMHEFEGLFERTKE